ncbi:MAG TPA: carbamoyltransferase HypF [Candidatus Binatia bacterium]|jgi:hydrogenase maturation protein HypF
MLAREGAPVLDQHVPTTAGLRIRIEGAVQGVGMRPWVHALASRHSIAGRIWNDSDAVTIEAFGAGAGLDCFVANLGSPPMPAARIRNLSVEAIPFQDVARFEIVASSAGGERRPSIPPDLALCADCRSEILDPDDRRFGYCFTNCTRCGPRFTIALDVPYDRERTSMAPFVMCEKCRREYDDPSDRRFHAQPNACPICGPSLELVDNRGFPVAGDPIEAAAELLAAGRIVAIKGLGGYHLACDASSQLAVERLRQRKHRYAKPLAVMAPSLEAARSLAPIGPVESDLLESAAHPIVLLDKALDAPLADAIAPASRMVGVMLPYTPLHELLLQRTGRTLVMTSGNVSDEPMCFDDDDAASRLAPVVDALLRHSRRIVCRCDDSIVRVLGGAPTVLRRARGLVPAAIDLAVPTPMPLLACGAHLKNAFCLASGRAAWLGPHIGDLETDEACRGFEDGIDRFASFVGIEPEAFVHDLHPGYFSTRWALSRGRGVTIGVQHHHAHIASAIAEHGIDGPVLGLAWDGTGDGGDGTAWGGELLAADSAGFVRMGTLRPIALAGGDAAIREVWRLALSLVDDAFDGDAPIDGLHLFDEIPAANVALVRRMIATGLHSPCAHGAGRYFDAFGALVLGRGVSSYEGSVAAALEAAAAGGEGRAYPFAMEAASSFAAGVSVVDLRPAVRAVVFDLIGGTAPATVAARIHSTMAAVADQMVAGAMAELGPMPVVLSGGCFQNALLLARTRGLLLVRGRVVTHRDVPPNDGGIALGQAAIAAATLRGERSVFGGTARRAEVR